MFHWAFAEALGQASRCHARANDRSIFRDQRAVSSDGSVNGPQSLRSTRQLVLWLHAHERSALTSDVRPIRIGVDPIVIIKAVDRAAVATPCGCARELFSRDPVTQERLPGSRASTCEEPIDGSWLKAGDFEGGLSRTADTGVDGSREPMRTLERRTAKRTAFEPLRADWRRRQCGSGRVRSCDS